MGYLVTFQQDDEYGYYKLLKHASRTLSGSFPPKAVIGPA
jgi:hypothetical protein